MRINSTRQLYNTTPKLEKIQIKSLEFFNTKNQLEKVVHNVKNIIFQIDGFGKFIFLNSAWKEITGYEINETIGESYAGFLNNMSIKDVSEYINIKNQNDCSLIFEINTKNGNKKWVDYKFNHSYNKNNKSIGGIGTIVDITDLKNVEQMLIVAKEKEKKANKAKGEFLSTMSHEIRTPLNTIVGISDILLMQYKELDQTENLKALKYSSDFLLSLINDILDFNKINAGKIELEENDFSLDYLVKSLAKNFRSLADKKNISLHVKKDILVPTKLNGDKTRLSQVLNNLIANAIKFTQKGSVELNITLTNETDEFTELYFEVIDTGIGIAKNNLKKIFELFQQAESSTTRKFGGSGLGLAICKKLLKIQNSDLFIESTLDKGSKFYFTLRFKKSTNSITKTDVALTNIQNTFVGLEDKKILIAEDFQFNVMVLKQFLDMWHIKYDIANNGQEAINLYNKNTYDIILMDLQMPIMDGYEATSEIRKMEQNENFKTPIIALTASAQLEVQNETINKGFDAFLSKPFDPINLFNTIKSNVVN